MIAITNAENFRQYNIRYYLITEQVLAFALHCNMVCEVKNLSRNFKQIFWRCFLLLNIFIWIVRPILLLNSTLQFQIIGGGEGSPTDNLNINKRGGRGVQIGRSEKCSLIQLQLISIKPKNFTLHYTEFQC